METAAVGSGITVGAVQYGARRGIDKIIVVKPKNSRELGTREASRPQAARACRASQQLRASRAKRRGGEPLGREGDIGRFTQRRAA
jgi:hypothetical protein